MIEVTPDAINKIKELLEKENETTLFLRLGVKGGGCSGLSYSMVFDKNRGEHDRLFEFDGIKVICDPKSYLYLNGLKLEYSYELIDGGFKFINPSATRSCSCGKSFAAA